MTYAGPGRRAADGIIDLIVCFFILWLVGLAAGETTDGGFALTGPAAFGGFVVVILYFIIMEATIGASVGKLCVGLRVVNDADGSPVGWTAAAVRNVLRVIDGLFFYLVGFIMVCATAKRQRLGDKAAGTAVIRRA